MRPGQVVKNPAFMASIQVDGMGLKAALWRYVTMSRFLLSSYTLFATGVASLLDVSACGDMSIVHMPFALSRVP